MADLVYNQAKFNELINRLDSNITKIEGELETFERNFQIIRANWSGTEFDKAAPKLLEIKTTLERALNDQRSQKNYLERKNQDFASQVSGL